jgi:hypothetical protein
MTSRRLGNFPMCPQPSGPRPSVVERRDDHSSERKRDGGPVIAACSRGCTSAVPWLEPRCVMAPGRREHPEYAAGAGVAEGAHRAGCGLGAERKSRDRQGRSWTTPFGSPRATGSVPDPESEMPLPHARLQVPCGSFQSADETAAPALAGKGCVQAGACVSASRPHSVRFTFVGFAGFGITMQYTAHAPG